MLTASAQRVEELVAIDLCRADDERRVGLLFSVARENPYAVCAELVAELVILRVRQSLEWTRVPGALAFGEQTPYLLARDPSLAAARRRGDENVLDLKSGERFELERVGLESGSLGRTDAFKQFAQGARARLTTGDARGRFGGGRRCLRRTRGITLAARLSALRRVFTSGVLFLPVASARRVALSCSVAFARARHIQPFYPTNFVESARVMVTFV